MYSVHLRATTVQYYEYLWATIMQYEWFKATTVQYEVFGIDQCHNKDQEAQATYCFLVGEVLRMGRQKWAE